MTKVETLLKEAMELSDDDREYLAYELTASVPRSDEDDEAYARELLRRIAAIDAGEVELIDIEEADRLVFGDDDTDE